MKVKDTMIDVRSLSGLPVAVFGLGRSGLATAVALGESGARVWAWDDDANIRERAAAQGVPLVDLETCDWSKLVALVFSPGIPLHHPTPHPVAKRAQAAGVEIMCDIELLARSQPQATLLGITGTNGKSTTTALIGHILEAAGSEVAVGGNLGVPALELEPLGTDGTYVLEMSSYQLDLVTSAVFDIAVMLNISPDHLDRHGGMAGYITAKKAIFRGQAKSQTAIIGIDDEHGRAMYDELVAGNAQNVIPISGHQVVSGGVYVSESILYDATGDGPAVVVVDLADLSSLPGKHNAQNAAAAYAAARAAGVTADAIVKGLNSFPGLAHRQELVGVIDGISYVNDSKATNVDAAARALVCYGDIYWIAGGRAKDGGLNALSEHYANVRQAFLIGEAANDMAKALDGHVAWTISTTLPGAVADARQAALNDRSANKHQGGVVLLSPACASFDQFKNFEARGDAFRDIVATLSGHHDMDEVGT